VSYPSGHATFAYVDAIILADMLPEKAAAIFARADAYAHNRVIEGVHYPSDLEAGRISGSVIDNVFLHNERFIADYEKARVEVRHALGLP
jgi:acid phosphatase (class A)